VAHCRLDQCLREPPRILRCPAADPVALQKSLARARRRTPGAVLL
jgi:hypothetical protein